MPNDDRSYYLRRIEQERRQAEAALEPEIQRVHAELAERYAELLKPALSAR